MQWMLYRQASISIHCLVKHFQVSYIIYRDFRKLSALKVGALLWWSYLCNILGNFPGRNLNISFYRQTQLLESHVSGHIVKKEVTEEGEVRAGGNIHFLATLEILGHSYWVNERVSQSVSHTFRYHPWHHNDVILTTWLERAIYRNYRIFWHQWSRTVTLLI